MRLLAGALLAALLAQGCSREEPNTVVLSGKQPPPAMAPAAVPASAPVVPAPAPAPEPVPDVAPPTPPRADADGASLLAAKRLLLPVDGVPASALRDTYTQGRGGRVHEAIDIMAPRGTKVFAVEDGTVAKLFLSKPGGLTVYHFDPTGQLAYYYAHLDRYADGLKEGMQLRRGDLVGYVGSTGNAAPDGPHLHFAVFRLGPEKQWWKGEPINPFPALSR